MQLRKLFEAVVVILRDFALDTRGQLIERKTSLAILADDVLPFCLDTDLFAEELTDLLACRQFVTPAIGRWRDMGGEINDASGQ